MNLISRFFSLIGNVTVINLKKFNYLVRYKYPKGALLIFSVLLAYYIFKNPIVSGYVKGLGALGYFGIFLAGVLFSFGFSAPFAVGFLIIAQPENIYFAALIAGFGAVISDLLIYKFIKVSFMEEFNRLKGEKPIKKINKMIEKHVGLKISTYLLYFLAGIVLSSPLPDEIAIVLLAGLTTIKPHILGLISLLLNTLGIFIILFVSIT